MMDRKHKTREDRKEDFPRRAFGGGGRGGYAINEKWKKRHERACCRAWGRCRGGVDTDTTAGGEREVGRD